MTLLSRLLILVAVALVPAIAIQAYNEYGLRHARRVEAQSQVLGIAKLAAAEHQQIIQGVQQILLTLSELPAIRAKDSGACNTYLASVNRQFPAFLAFLVSDVEGNTFCNTVGPNESVNVSKRSYFAHAITTGAFTVGEYSTGLIAPQKIIQFALAYRDEKGRIAGLIIAGMRLDWLADHMAQKGAPPGAAFAITDRNGIYLARYPNNALAVGRKMQLNLTPKLDEEMTADITDIDDVERIVGFSELAEDSGGLIVSFGLDKAQAFAAIQNRTVLDILMIALSAALVLALTTIGARRFIDRPLGQLVEAANAWRRGDFGRRVHIEGVADLGRVGSAFNIMAQALQQRERELHQAKEKAEEAATKITTIFESTTDSVVVLDKAWHLTYLNQRARDQLAQGRDIIGHYLYEAFPGREGSDIFHQLEEAMKSQRVVSFEGFCLDGDRWFLLNAYPSDEGLAVYFRDMTEHRRALEARRLAEEELHQAQKMEATGQLTGGIAHDFNNLLTVVQLKLEAIVDRSADEDIRNLAAAAQLAAERGAKLTGQLLAFSRRQRLEPKLVSVNESIGEFAGLIRRAIGAEREVKLLLDDHLWRCHIDPGQLQTALLNLALNARDAMDDGGVVTIRTSNVVLEEDAAPGCPAGAYVRIAFTDTGRGMPADVVDRAFEPFFTTKEVGRGSGLGLSMVYGFVRQSGGDVVIDSAPGAGTTVSLLLPKAAAALTVEAAAPVKPPKTTGTERILVVEDDDAILAITSEFLTSLGYHVTCATNGPEALHILTSGQEFELLFTDIGMPHGMNGVELAREAKRLNGELKILLTSGYAGDVLDRNGAAREFPIIAKPFLGAELAQSVRSVLQD